MEEKLSLVITLPESLAGLPIRFEVNSGCRNIALNLESSTPIKKKYLLIWNQTDYLKVDDEDILWIKADGSYSCIHFRDGNKMMVSINLANIMKGFDDMHVSLFAFFLAIVTEYFNRRVTVSAVSSTCNRLIIKTIVFSTFHVSATHNNCTLTCICQQPMRYRRI